MAIPSTNPNAFLSIGRDLAVNPATGKMYFRITANGPTQLGVLNGTIGTGLPNIGNVNIIRTNGTLNRVYVGSTPTNGGANEIHVYDGATDVEIATIEAGSSTNYVTNQTYLAINEATNRIFASNFDEDTLDVIDALTNTVIARIPVGFGPSTVAVNTALNRVYVGSAHSRELTIIDGATLRVVRRLALPIAAVRLAVDESLTPARIYAQSTGSEASIAVIDDPGGSAPLVTGVGPAAQARSCSMPTAA